MSIFGNSKPQQNSKTNSIDSSGGGIFGNNNGGGGGGGLFGNSSNNNNGGGGGIFGGGGNNNNSGGGGGIFGGGGNNNSGGGVFGGSGGGNEYLACFKNNGIREDYKKDTNVSDAKMLPNDSVQCIKWCKNENHKIFVSGDWAGDVKIYKFDVNGNNFSLNLVKSQNFGAPIFEVDWSEDSSLIYIALTTGVVKAMQLQSGNVADVAKHEGLTCMEAGNFQNKQILITMGTDKRLKIWSPGNTNPLLNVELKALPLTSDFSYPFLAIAFSQAVIGLINFETFGKNQNVNYFKSNLKSPLQCISLRPLSKRLAVASIDGRICISDFDFDYNGKLKTKDYILFRAHRNEKKNQPKKSHVYQVNSIGFHAKFKNFLYTAGGNSVTYFWDCVQKKQSAEFHYGGLGTTAAAMSPCGNLFAYSLGYDWCYGVWGTAKVDYRPLMCVHVCKSGDIRKN